jgi:replication-associated recombination protein RarA
MIPDTRSGLPAMACVSAMQKAIRRGMERDAMEFAVELMHTSKAFHSMVCSRLEIICHEDLDTIAAPWVFPFVQASLAASRDRYSSKIGEARLMIGNCIRMMARAPKSRAGCHFAAAIGLRSMLEDFAPTIPDWANDMHTMKGKAMGRGLDHFRKEGAKLVPEPTTPDPYIEEAYRLWAIKRQSGAARPSAMQVLDNVDKKSSIHPKREPQE